MGLLDAYAEILRVLGSPQFGVEKLVTDAIKKGLMENFLWDTLIKNIWEPCFRGSWEQICLISYDALSHLHEITQAIGG
jgi:hypothetical protein